MLTLTSTSPPSPHNELQHKLLPAALSLFSKCDPDSQILKNLKHLSLLQHNHPVWFTFSWRLVGSVRTRSRTSTSCHQTGRTRLHRLPELRTRVRTLCTGFGVHQERHKEPFWCTLLAPEAFIVPATVCTALHWIDVTLSLSPRTEISVTPVNHMESPYSHQRRHETAEIVQPWNVRKLVLKVTNPRSASSVHCIILSLSYILSD